MEVLDGRPVPKPGELQKIDREIAKAAEEVEADPWAVKLEAVRRKRAQRESERERFITEHQAELAAELVAGDVAATAELEAAYRAVLAAHGARQAVGQDLDAVVRVMPPPSDAATYRLGVRSDQRVNALVSQVRHQLDAGLEPLSPRELLAGEDEEDEPATEAPPRTASENHAELLRQREQVAGETT